MKIYSTVILILLMAVSASFGANIKQGIGRTQEETNNAAIAGVETNFSKFLLLKSPKRNKRAHLKSFLFQTK